MVKLCIVAALATTLLRADAVETTTVETPHLKLAYSAASASVSPGGRVTLIADVSLGPGLHVYAPGVEHGYIPIAWNITETRAIAASKLEYPPSHTIEFAALKEIVPVYEGHLRLTREVTIAPAASAPDGKISIEGSFRYQACNDRECFPPRTLSMKWTLPIAAIHAH